MEKNSNTGINTAYDQLGLLEDASSLPAQMISWHCPLNMENKKDNPSDYDSDETYYDAGGSSMRPNLLSAPNTAGQFVSNNVPGLLQVQKTKSGPTMEGPTTRPTPIPVSTEINEDNDTGSDLNQFVNEVLPSILGDFDLNDGQDNQWCNSNEFIPHSQFIDNNRWTDSNFDNEINKLTSQITLDHFLNSQESYDESIATNVTNDDTLVDLFNVSASQHHDYSISQENRNAIVDNACFRAVSERSNKKPAKYVSNPNSIGKRMKTIRALLKGKKPVEKLKCPTELTIQLRSRENTTLKGVPKSVPQTVRNMTVKSISTRKHSQPRVPVNNSDGEKLIATRLEKWRKSNKDNKPSRLDNKNKVQSSKPQMKKHQRASKRTSQTCTTRRPAQSITTELNKMRDEVSEIQDDIRTSLFYDGTPLTGWKANEYLMQLHRHLERLDTVEKGPKELKDEIRHVIGQLVCTLNKCLNDMKLVTTQGAEELYLWQNETIFEESEKSSQSSDEPENSDQEVSDDSASDDICIINDAFECISITSSPVPSVTGDNQFEGQESFDMFQTYEEPIVIEELNRTNESQGDSTYFTQSQKEPDNTSNVQLCPKVCTQKVKTSQEKNYMDTRMLLEETTPMEVTQNEEINHSVRKPFSVSAIEMGAQKQPIQTQTVAITQPEYSNVTKSKRKPFYDFHIGRMRAVSNDEILVLDDIQSSPHSSDDFIDDTPIIDLTEDNEPDDENNKIDVVSLAKEKYSSIKFLVPVVKTTTRRFDLAGHEKVPEKVVCTGMNSSSSMKPQLSSPDYSDTQMMLEETQCSFPESTKSRPILPAIGIKKMNNSFICQPQRTVLPVTNFTPKLSEINVSIPEKIVGQLSDAKNTNVSPRPTQSCLPIRSCKTVMNLNEITGELECLYRNETQSNKRHSQELLGSDDDTVSPEKKYKLRSHVKSADVSPHSIQSSSPLRSYRTVMNLNEITGKLEYLHENQIQTNKQDGQELFGSDSDMMSPQKKHKPSNEENLVSLHKNTQKCVKVLTNRPNVHTKHFMKNHEHKSNSSEKSRETGVVTIPQAFSTSNRNNSENFIIDGGNLTQVLLEDTWELMDESLKQTTSFQTDRTLQPPFSARNASVPTIVKIKQLRSTPMEISCVPSGTNKISKRSPQSKALSLKVYPRARKSPTIGVIQQFEPECEVNSKKNQRKVCIDLPIEPDSNHSFFETQDVEMSNVENLPKLPLLFKSNHKMKSPRILQPMVNFSNDINIKKPGLSIASAKTQKLSDINIGMKTQILIDETESVKHSKPKDSPMSISKISIDMQNKSKCEKIGNSPANPTVSIRSFTDGRANAGLMKAIVSMDVENETKPPKSYLFVQNKKTFAPTKSRAFIDREREEERRLIMGIKSVFIHSPNEWVPHTKEMADFWKMPFDKIPEEIQKDLENSD